MMDGRGGGGGRARRCIFGHCGVLTPFFPFDEATRIGLSYRTNECTGGIICGKDAEYQGHAQVTILSMGKLVCLQAPPPVRTSTPGVSRHNDVEKSIQRSPHTDTISMLHCGFMHEMKSPHVPRAVASPQKAPSPSQSQICAERGNKCGPLWLGLETVMLPAAHPILSCHNQSLESLPEI